MSFSTKSTKLSFKKTIAPRQTYISSDEKVNTFTSTTFDIASTSSIVFRVYAGKYNNGGDYVELNEKTVTRFYSKCLNVESDNIFITLDNSEGTEPVDVFLQTVHSFTKQPNSIVRQHELIDNTENVSLVKEASTFDSDLTRNLFQNQQRLNLYGSAFGTSVSSHILWNDVNNDVYDELSTGVSVVVQTTSTLDASGSDGARIIKLHGLTSDFSEITEEITMNGLSVIGACPFMRVNSAEVISSGVSLFNVGDITIHPYDDTSKILERIDAENNLSSTFHYTVPKDKTLVLSGIDLHGVQEDNSLFRLKKITPASGVCPFDGTPALESTLLYNAVANGEWSIMVDRKFETGETIHLDIQSDPDHPVHIGVNRFYATTPGLLITNKF